MKRRNSTFIQHISVQNYKSIATCDLDLGELRFLVGPNGSGKSNFLDALRFVADSLRGSVDLALRDRGGINEVRRRSGGHPNHFGIDLSFVLPDGSVGEYGFRVGARPQGGFEVQEETCHVKHAVTDDRLAEAPDHTISALRSWFSESTYQVKSGEVVHSSLPSPPAAVADRLYLVNASGFKEFRPVFDALSHMGFYNPSPTEIRRLQPPDAGELLKRNGSNIASVLARLERQHAANKSKIEEYLSKVVPGISGVSARSLGQMETLEFRQAVSGARHPWRFLASNMSDGTLRALSVLVALFQAGNGTPVSLVGVEEPESALHPGAAGVLLDGLEEASRATQVLVTSHSPDLLDDPKIDASLVVAVISENGVTRVGPPDQAGKKAIKDRLYTAGELLRMNQLVPAQTSLLDPE